MTNPRYQNLWKLLLGLLLAPCGLLFYQTSAGLSAQSVGEVNVLEIFDNLIVVFALLFLVARLPNRLVELAKPVVDSRIPETRPNLRLFMILSLSLLFGMATAVVLNLNILLMFPDNPLLASAPHAAGVALTGFLLMFDANLWHQLGEAVKRREEVVEAQARAVRPRPFSKDAAG